MTLSDFQVRVWEIERALRAATEEAANQFGGTWYALHDSPYDQDDEFGSKSVHEAARMAVHCGAEEIALIYDDGLDITYATVNISELV